MNKTAKLFIGPLFALILFVVFDRWIYIAIGRSFTSEFLAGSVMPIVVFVAGCVIGMAWEYIGQMAFRWWHYPRIRMYPWLLMVLPLFHGLLMLIFQDAYAIARIIGHTPFIAWLIATLVVGAAIEGINLLTRSWVYEEQSASISRFILGWLVFSYTYVLGFNAFFINPFGL